MSDTQSVTQPEQEPVSSGNTGSSDSTTKNQGVIVIIVGLVVAVICLCIGACIVAGGWGTVTGLIRVAQERDDVTAVIDEYMQEMEKENAEAAYALFSKRAQRQVPLSNIEELLEGNNYVVFDGYKSVEVTNLNIKAAFNTNPDLPQGTIAEAAGVVTYEGGVTGQFTATLEEENDGWSLHYIHITVPPSKLNSP